MTASWAMLPIRTVTPSQVGRIWLKCLKTGFEYKFWVAETKPKIAPPKLAVKRLWYSCFANQAFNPRN